MNPTPSKKTEVSKLNPLQRLVYLGLKILVIPVQVGTGLLYYFYNEQIVQTYLAGQLKVIAVVHTIGGFALLAFLAGHIYLITTGRTPGSNLKAMISGWEDIEEDEVDAPASSA